MLTCVAPIRRGFPRLERDVVRLPLRRLGQPDVWTRLRADGTSAAASWLSTPISVSPERGTRFTNRRNASANRIEIGVDVRVIELDVVHHRDVGQVLEELGGLVEVGAVVFVAFDHERAPVPRGSSLPPRPKLRAMPPTSTVGSTPPCVSSHPASDVVVVLPWVPATTIERVPHRKKSRTASGNDNSGASVEHGLELWIAARDGVAHDHQLDRTVDVLVRNPRAARCLHRARKSLIGG